MSDHISDYLLERYLLQELPGRRMAEIRRRLENDSALRNRLEALERSNGELLQKYPAARVVPEILRARQAEAAPQAPLRRWRPGPMLAMAAAAALLLVITPSLWHFFSETTRMKGDAVNLFVYRKLPAKAELLKPKALARPGDVLQLAYFSQRDEHGVILSLDGRGTVTLHYPASSQASTRISLHRRTVLASAYELDDAPAFERFFLITSPVALPVHVLMESAKQLALYPNLAMTESLPVPDQASQTSFLIRKGE